ncbi:unnamed protein product [Dracunculus medinensis]|uniref:Small ribosomal subunit protein mS29 n=1 Tax=Dracunculus medinensis TaxID=318479 RepID=A0A0N4U2I0_DRAME|nr:unnamed protein product [Dracunculus medinensis]
MLFFSIDAQYFQAFLSVQDLGHLYEVPMKDVEELNYRKVLPSPYKKQIETLNECLWMYRESLWDVITCLQAVRPTFPSLRIVLWGKFGTGKTITLHQAVHYAFTQNWVIFVVPDAMRITRCTLDIQMSSHHVGRVDCPALGKELLENFKLNNAHLWEKLSELVTEKDYVWSRIDKTESGRPITDIVDMGISMPYAASDCVGALLKELKRYSSSGKIRFLVAIDAANSLFGRTTVRRSDRKFVNTADLTLVHCMKKLLSNDWTNGCCIMVADKKEFSNPRDEETVPLITPLELFGEEGIDSIEPFIPIETKLYTVAEANSIYEYYKSKRWIVTEKGRSERGKKELIYLSAFSPFYLERMCAFL